MRYLLLALALLFVGCGKDHKHPFFEPEIPDATYAVRVGDPTADDSPSKVTKLVNNNNYCYYVPMYGWTCMNDIITDGQVWKLVDDDRYLAAPRFKPISMP